MTESFPQRCTEASGSEASLESLRTPENFPRERFLAELMVAFDRGGDYTVKSPEEILAYLQDPFPNGWESSALGVPRHQVLLFDHIVSRFKGFEKAAYGTRLERTDLMQYLEKTKNESFLNEIAEESIALRNDLLRVCGVPGQTNEWGRYRVSDTVWNAPYFDAMVQGVRTMASFRCDFQNERYRNWSYVGPEHFPLLSFGIRSVDRDSGENVPWDAPNSIRVLHLGTEEEMYGDSVKWHG